MKIYTRSGDNGHSSIISQKNISKTDDIFELLGTLDEVSCILGLANALSEKGKLKDNIEEIQKQIMLICEEIAGGKDFVKPEDITDMESLIDSYLPKQEEFEISILRESDLGSAMLNLARAVIRRAERVAVRLKEQNRIKSIIVTYLNRLSDLMYALSRS